MPVVEIIVKIDDASTDKMAEIAEQCKIAGMNVEQQMKSVGMISGSIEQADISRIEQIEGVSYVEESKAI